MNLDIIIPTLNEAEYIGPTIENIYTCAADINKISIWISDCASSDGTLEEAGKYTVNIPNYDNPPTSRSTAMNFATEYSSGDVLLFLHADVAVPMHFDKLILETLSKPGIVGGAFNLLLDGTGFVFRLIERINYIRYHLFPLYFGDQAIFVTRSAFMEVGKFPDVHIMEGAQFCRRLWKTGRMGLVKKKVVVSSRRFIEGGPWRVFAFDAWCTIRHILHISNEKYSVYYKENNLKRSTKTDLD